MSRNDCRLRGAVASQSSEHWTNWDAGQRIEYGDTAEQRGGAQYLRRLAASKGGTSTALTIYITQSSQWTATIRYGGDGGLACCRCSSEVEDRGR
jgi:hypothetical protein